MYCSCGRSLKTLSKNQTMNWTRRTSTPCQFPVTSIKKNLTHGAKHGVSRATTNVLQAEGCCRKLAKAWWIQFFLERWHKDDKHRKSLSEIGWTEEKIVHYDELALEDHSYDRCILSKSLRLMKVGQKRKSDSTTHLPWKTVPMKLHLQKGDDGKGIGK